MFVLMFYDVGEKRVAKVLKTARRYLTWIQNSVLEGELSPAQFESLKVDVKKILKDDYDSVLLYAWRTERYMTKDIIGVERGTVDFMI
ncbi:CRISPR-associated protein Cas2 [Synergistales bacterium]|nr:CRISPR-associated protein Cas2 [Synergistales bacterium]